MSRAPYRPSDDELRAFREDGFLITPPLFDARTLSDVRDTIERLWNERNEQIGRSAVRGAATMAAYSRVRPELQRLHLDSPQLSRFCRSEPLAELAGALIGDDVDLSWNQAYTKLPGGDSRTEIPWHQDDWYARIDGPRINCWVAVSRTTVANGTIVRAPRPSALLPHVWDEALLFYRCAIDESASVAVELEPGQAFIFDGCVPHRSGVNVSDASRVAYSISFASPTARLEANGEAFGDRVPVLRGGRRADELLVAFAREPSNASLPGARVFEEIVERAPRRADEARAMLAAVGEASARHEADARETAIARLVSTLEDSSEVLGDLVRSRARVDQLLRELANIRGSSPDVERALLERVIALEPGHADAKAALALLGP